MARITNREYIISLLQDSTFIDDGGAAYEAMVHYNINCPYFEGDDRAHCHGQPDDFICRKNCVPCKEEWLDQEVDE